MSWKPAVKVFGESAWSYNALRFDSKAECEAWLRDLSARWTLVKEWQAQESNDPVNYRFTDGELVEAG